MDIKTLRAVFTGGSYCKTRPLTRQDYGIKLQFVHADLDQYGTYQVHFSNVKDNNGTAKTQIADVDGVVIPDEYLITGKTVYAWAFVQSESAGRTRYMVEIPVAEKPTVTPEEPTPQQRSAIDEAIDALNTGVARAETAAEDAEAAAANIQQTVDDALQAAKDSGEFDGRDGVDGTDGVNGVTFTPDVDAAGNISWTNDGGLPNPQTRNIKGPQGEKLTYADLTAADKADLVQGPIADAQTAAEDAVNHTGTTQVQAVADKGAEVLQSIPSDYTELSEDVDGLKSAVKSTVSLDFAPVAFSVDSTGYIKHADGTVVSSTLNSYTDYVDVSWYYAIRFKLQGSTANNPLSGMAFYDENYSYIIGASASGSQASAGYMPTLAEVLVPTTAKYARFTVYTDVSTYGSFELYGETEIADDVKDLVNTVYTDNDIDLQNAEVISRIIAASTGKWASGGTSYIVKTQNAKTITIIGNATNGSVLGILKDRNTTNGTVPNYATGCKREFIPKGRTKEFDIPDDAKYAVIMRTYSSTDYTPEDAYFRYVNFATDEDVAKAIINNHVSIPTVNVFDTVADYFALWDELLVTDGGENQKYGKNNVCYKETLTTVHDLPVNAYMFSFGTMRMLDGADYNLQNEAPGEIAFGDYMGYGTKKKIMLISGMHGNEKGTPSALLQWMYNLCYNPEYKKYQCFDYYVIPIANPTGYNANTRNNADGININRDAFDKQSAEAQAITDFIDNQTYEMFFDFHQAKLSWESTSIPYYGFVGQANATQSDVMAKVNQHISKAIALCDDVINEYFGKSDNPQGAFVWEGSTEAQSPGTFTKFGIQYAPISCTFETSQTCPYYSGSTSDYYNKSAMVCNQTFFDHVMAQMMELLGA